MVRTVLMVVIVASALCGQALAADTTEATFVATIVAMRAVTDAGEAEAVELDLRVDVSEQESVLPGKIARLRLTADQQPENRPRLGLGDQVRLRAELAPATDTEGVALAGTAAGPIEWLGRGEFINPGERPTLDRGSPEAKVLVKMLAPLAPDCHRKTLGLLIPLAARHPKHLRLQVFDMMSPGGRAEMNRERLSCATVLVNNRHDFEIKEGDQLRKVQFSRLPNAPISTYRSEDVVTVVEREIARLYGGEK